MARRFGKLVRDRIPDHIRAQGGNPVVRVLPQEEYVDQLHEKLKEEVAEYLEAQSLEELCDILEVLEAIAQERGFLKEQILAVKAEKAKKNGVFRCRLFLEGVEK